MKQYILDTSALLAYIENEEGVTEIQGLFEQALDDQIELFVSVVSCIEVFYISWQEQGANTARDRLKLITDLPVTQQVVDDAMVETVATLKATKIMSFADCCIAGLAIHKNAILVHKDPEYEQVGDQFQQVKLPYKKKVTKPIAKSKKGE